METDIESFLTWLEFEKRYSAHTVRAYQDDLVQFFDFAALEFDVKEPKEISSVMVRSWLASLKESGLSSRSINRKISTLKSFYKYQMRMGKVEQSPLGAVISPKTKKRLPAYVEQKDVKALFEGVVFPADWEGRTDMLMMAVLYQTGMRLSELVGLKERSVDKHKRVIKVLGKGNKERLIPVGPLLIDAIAEYCQRKRVELEGPDVQVLFVTSKGKAVYAQYVYRAVRKYLAQVTTIDKKSPHVLRHSFATHLMNQGADLNSVKELLGHSSLAATQVYTHNTIEKLKEVYKQAHPKA